MIILLFQLIHNAPNIRKIRGYYQGKTNIKTNFERHGSLNKNDKN